MGRQGHVVLRCGRPSALAGSFASMMKEALLQNLAVPDDGVSCIDLAQRVEKSGFVVVPQCLQGAMRSEEHTSELQSRSDLVCRLLLEKKKNINKYADDMT